MKFSYNWIRELVGGLELAPRELERMITLKTAECEGIEPAGLDWVIDIDNKSITHRPDLWGHLGMAREVAAFSGKPLRDPVHLEMLPPDDGAVKVAIEDLDLCPRYSALVFENVTVKPSPAWLQTRLETIGLNPINNIVDFTNLVMAELGQPTHAFDRGLLHSDSIIVRRARPGERVAALNDQEYALDPVNLVIADEQGAVAIAGVIGGAKSAISPATRSIVLESACFLGSSIRKTSTQLKLRTDASVRFEKSQDPANTVRALARAMELLPELSPGIRVLGGVSDLWRQPALPQPIRLPMDWLQRKLGRAILTAEVRGILECLAFLVTEPEPGLLEVRVPSWRATRDVSIKDDLVEEVGRMVGYASIAPQAPAVLAAVPWEHPERLFLRSVRRTMADQGFTEVSNYSFISDDQARALGFDPAQHVQVANPIASDQSLMRTSLLPGIVKNIADNSRHFDSFRFFEVGREIHPQAQGLPLEIPHLAAVVYSKGSGEEGLLEIKRAAECLLPGAATIPSAAREFEHPARSADLHWRGAPVGRIFEFHPDRVEGRAAVLYINLQAVQGAPPRDKRYRAVRRFPSSAFDLSVVAGARELVGDLESKLAGFIPSELLESIAYLRQYVGPPLDPGQKSVSFRVTAGSSQRTLSSDEVSAIRTAIIDGMRELGYELRV